MKLFGSIRKALIEALGGSLLGDQSGADSDRELIGFRPISQTSGKKLRDLNMQSHADMLNIALYIYNSKPIGRFLVDMPVSLVVGQELGYSVAINPETADITPDAARKQADAIRKVLDKFWYHPAHNIGDKAPEYAITYLVTGHLVLPITAVNEVDGSPQFDLIDAAQIAGVDPLNGSAIVPGVVRFKANDRMAQKELAYIVLQHNEDGLMIPQAPEQVQAGEGIPAGVELKGECLYFRYNALLNSMRGVSYLADVADWIDALDQFTWTILDRAKLGNAIVFHLKLQGLTEPKLTEEVNRLTAALVSPGSVYGSNGEVELSAVTANVGDLTISLGRMILTHILGAKGIPESWYSNGGDANRATAGEQTDVAYKHLIALQTRLRAIYRTMLWVAYDSAQAKQPAVFPKRTESPWLTLEPNMPIVQERDLSRLAAAAAQVSTGLEGAIAAKLISEKSSRRTFLDILGQCTGGAFELDIEEQQIESETEEREKREAELQADMVQQKLARGMGGDGKDDAPSPPPS